MDVRQYQQWSRQITFRVWAGQRRGRALDPAHRPAVGQWRGEMDSEIAAQTVGDQGGEGEVAEIW